MFDALVIVFLTSAVPVIQTVAPTAPPPAELKLVCRREVVTGSMVTFKKRCMTRRDWARTVDRSQEFAREMVDTFRTKPAGN